MDEITLLDGGDALAATVTSAPHPSGAAVLLVHGLGSDRRTNVERAEALTRTYATTCLAVDLRGHGSSSGRLSELTPRMNLHDVLRAYDALLAQPGVWAGRVGVCAASYGAYLSVLLASRRDVARLLLRAPALYVDDGMDTRLGSRQWGSAETAGSLLGLLGSYDAPLLVVESERDEVVGPDVVAAYLAAAPHARHRVLAQAGHALTDPSWRAAFERLVLDFFADL